MSLKLQFQSLSYQSHAVQQVIDLFVGQPHSQGDFVIQSQLLSGSYTEQGFGNNILLDSDTILQNLYSAQTSFNQLKREQYSLNLDPDSVPWLLDVSSSLDNKDYGDITNFSVEMETGTGKTYVYLKTIYELHKTYGFNKFIIIVPSVAIREWTWKSLSITREHFEKEYDLTMMKAMVYDSKRMSMLRDFATTNDLRIMITTIDAINKDSNLFNRSHDRMNGLIPRELVQWTKPFVIIDEPQSVDNTAIAKNAIKNLHPSCILRYSATHKELYHPVYRLTPVDAYDMWLVKKIEVISALTEQNANQAFVRLEKLIVGKTQHKAELSIDIEWKQWVERKKIRVSVWDDLFSLSNYREHYRDGYYVSSIDNSPWFECVEFSNGWVVQLEQSNDAMQQELIRSMIADTIREHFDKERSLKAKWIKVLSLFFLDKVANYRLYGDDGYELGDYAKMFEEEYTRISQMPQYKDVIPYTADQVHNGYFSADKKWKWKDKKEIWKDTNGSTQKDDETYNLIMKDKERLLDINEPLRFIFSHSALREWWDNPNVFQICTLRETQNVTSKRQEIGRGLRLPVNQQGERVIDSSVAKLTVIANEHYEDFAKKLQEEIETETGISFANRIKNGKKKQIATFDKQKMLTDENFKELRKRIRAKTRYQVQFDTDKLIASTAKRIQEELPKINPPKIDSKKASLQMWAEWVTAELRNSRTYINSARTIDVPDILWWLQSKTFLTKATLLEILKQSSRLRDVLTNPQMFLDEVLKIILNELTTYMVDGIKYIKTGDYYDQLQFEQTEISGYLEDNLIPVHKSLYSHIAIDSKIETQFAKDLDSHEAIKFYLKLPYWFTIETPIWAYNPDWAIVLENDSKIYFVAETKWVEWLFDGLRWWEKKKIQCGKAHFAVIEEVDFKQVVNVKDIIL